MPRFVVIGGTGFIGSHLAAHLKNVHGSRNVLTLGSRDLNLLDAKGTGKRLRKLLLPSDTVLFCSALMKRHGDNYKLFAANTFMSENLGDALVAAPVRSLVLISSSGVYGEERDLKGITERTNTEPTSYYAMSKLVSERILHSKLCATKTRLLILRPPIVYGPGDTTTYGPSGFLRGVLQTENIRLWGDGSERRSFLYVEDLAVITERLLRKNASGVFNVCSSRSHSFRDCIRLIEKITGTVARVKNQARTKPAADNTYARGRLSKVLPRYKLKTLEQGLRAMIEAVDD